MFAFNSQKAIYYNWDERPYVFSNINYVYIASAYEQNIQNKSQKIPSHSSQITWQNYQSIKNLSNYAVLKRVILLLLFW